MLVPRSDEGIEAHASQRVTLELKVAADCRGESACFFGCVTQHLQPRVRRGADAGPLATAKPGYGL